MPPDGSSSDLKAEGTCLSWSPCTAGIQAFWRNHFKVVAEPSVTSLQLDALQKLMAVRHKVVKHVQADGLAPQGASATPKIVVEHAQLANLRILVLVGYLC